MPSSVPTMNKCSLYLLKSKQHPPANPDKLTSSDYKIEKLLPNTSKLISTLIIIGIIATGIYFISAYLNRPIFVLIAEDYKAICKEIPSSDISNIKHKQFSSIEKCNSSNEKIKIQKNFDDEIKANLKKLSEEKK